MMRKINLSRWDILVVDDDPPSISLIEAVFARHQANIYTAESGIDALYRLKTMQRPRVILCDVQMPYMNGYILLEKIRSNPSIAETPIIAVTAQAMIGDRERILAAGFDGYISKPFMVETFVHEILLIVQSAKADLRRDSV